MAYEGDQFSIIMNVETTKINNNYYNYNETLIIIIIMTIAVFILGKKEV